MADNNSYQRFTELNVWKEARAFKLKVYEASENFPVEEKYRLHDQIVRSARSICANISEGHGRFTYKDQLNFCIISRGSLTETLNHLIDAYDCKYISNETLQQLEQKYTSVEKLLNGYITFLRKARNDEQ